MNYYTSNPCNFIITRSESFDGSVFFGWVDVRCCPIDHVTGSAIYQIGNGYSRPSGKSYTIEDYTNHKIKRNIKSKT